MGDLRRGADPVSTRVEAAGFDARPLIVEMDPGSKWRPAKHSSPATELPGCVAGGGGGNSIRLCRIDPATKLPGYGTQQLTVPSSAGAIRPGDCSLPARRGGHPPSRVPGSVPTGGSVASRRKLRRGAASRGGTGGRGHGIEASPSRFPREAGEPPAEQGLMKCPDGWLRRLATEAAKRSREPGHAEARAWRGKARPSRFPREAGSHPPSRRQLPWRLCSRASQHPSQTCQGGPSTSAPTSRVFGAVGSLGEASEGFGGIDGEVAGSCGAVPGTHRPRTVVHSADADASVRGAGRSQAAAASTSAAAARRGIHAAQRSAAGEGGTATAARSRETSTGYERGVPAALASSPQREEAPGAGDPGPRGGRAGVAAGEVDDEREVLLRRHRSRSHPTSLSGTPRASAARCRPA